MENSNLSYKHLHEAFMQNHTGTSIEENVFILTPAPFTIFISAFLIKYLEETLIHGKTLLNSFVLFVVEFTVLVGIQIFLFMLPDYNIILCATLFCSGVGLSTVTIMNYFQETIKRKGRVLSFHKTPLVGKRPYITYFRTSVNLITTVCILAVDFTSFPRKLAKTEVYGFSLMATGVGFFVICNALVAHHVTKEEVTKDYRLYLLYRQLKQNSVLLALGFLRVISTSSVDYQNHYSEYGVHWNFFITLAFTRIISTFMLTFVRINNVKFLAFIIIFIHQTALSFGLESWVLSSMLRDDLINANREGIVSLLGYISLYLISVEIGNKLILKSTSIENDAKLAVKFILSALLLYFLLLQINNHFQCSRRLANISYILWIVMLTIYLLALCLIFELILRLHNSLKKLKSDERLVPSILLSINFNALSFFLLANLITGIVNLSVKTLYVSEMYSILIVILYMFLNCCISQVLYRNKFKLL